MNQPIPFPRDLSQKIQTVANQYQCQLILHQWGRFGASTFAVLLLFTGLLYAADSIGLSRLALLALWGMVESAMFYYFLVFQAKKPVALDQIALYIEENHPELENRLLSAIAFQQGQTQGSSQWMLEQFFQQTEEVIRPISLSDILETEVLTKFVLVGAGTFGLCFLLLTAFHRVWLPAPITSHQPEGTTAALPAFSVEPGSTRVRVGDSVIVVCRIQEPQETATLQWRTPQGQWKDETMQPGASVHESYYIFPTVQQTIEYQVAWGRHRSETFTLTAWQPPQVQALDVTYSPPAYLAQEPHTVPNSAGISALEGTRVALQVNLNKEVETALLIFNEGTVLPLRPLASNRWTAEWELQHSGSFVIQLIDTEGQENEVQPQYPVQVEPDRPPTITLSFPNRDLEVNALEEVPFIFTMQDDHGMTGFGLAYEIAGRPPVSIPLHEPHALPKASTGTTTLYLEDLQLSPGDLITWNVWATDQKPGRAETETMSDPYFLEIRPFKTLYQEAISNAGQSSEGQNQEAPGSEAASQKDVVIAIWNLRRDSSTLNELQFNEKRAAITEAERAILQNTAQADAAAVSALQQRTLVEALQQTIDALDNTTHADPSPSLTRAYSHAQEAYRLL
ncbi:MAG: hypothetical protein RBU29_14835 [bacterium]|jgi:hypothetical protein|nr:hypothetical protein [bacterium]